MAALILRPSVPDFGWQLDFGEFSMVIWYSEEHRQLVISQSDMARLSKEQIAIVEKLEIDMIDHMLQCEKDRRLYVASYVNG